MTQIYFEDIELGYEIDPVVKQPSHEELLSFCAVTHLTGRFVSEEGAHVDGLERVILSSWQSGAYLAQLLTSWMGAEGKLSSFDVIFRGLVPANGSSCAGTARAIRKKKNRAGAECAFMGESSLGFLRLSSYLTNSP